MVMNKRLVYKKKKGDRSWGKGERDKNASQGCIGKKRDWIPNGIFFLPPTWSGVAWGDDATKPGRAPPFGKKKGK
jgi:hypothetical protein